MKDRQAEIEVPRYTEWLRANQEYLTGELEWLRLILRSRVIWLRARWDNDPLKDYRDRVISDNQIDSLLHGESIDAERKFIGNNAEALEISKAIEERRRQSQALAENLSNSGTPTALDMLCSIFGLSEFDRFVLLMCLALEMDPAFERIYAYIQDDLTKRYVTPYLAHSLFAMEKEYSAVVSPGFLPDGPLLRFKLIHWMDSARGMHGRISCPLAIDPRIALYLRGINHLDERVADLVTPINPPISFPESYGVVVDKLQKLLETAGNIRRLPIINLTGQARTGKRDIVFKLGAALNLDFLRLNAKRLRDLGDRRREIVSVLDRECMLLPAALYVDADDPDGTDENVAGYLHELIERLNAFMIIGSLEPVHVDQNTFIVRTTRPNSMEQVVFWNEQLKSAGIELNGHLESVAEQFDFESDMVAKIISAAESAARIRGGDSGQVTINDIWNSSREQSQNDLDARAQRIEPCYNWEDIVLPANTLEQLRNVAAQVKHRALVYETWGFGAKMSRGRGISALFSGPSGTGKTMAAEILANHINLDLYRIDLSAVVSKYIGETEKNLRRVFDAAEQSGAILFFDEADALFGKRSEVKDSHDRYANIEINYLLQRMEEYRGLAILATNMKSLLDSAFLRRLRFHIEFPFPDASYRTRIWEKAFPPAAVLGKLDYGFLVRLAISGGNIKNIALNAAFLAAEDGRKIEMDHIVRATKYEYAKIGKMILESEFGQYYVRVKS